MTNIQEILTKILSSRYGKDMRQAIHDGIQQCNQDIKYLELGGATGEEIQQALEAYLEDHPIEIETDITLTANGLPADAKVVGDRLKKKATYFDNIESMKSDSSLEAGDIVVTLGYYKKNDEGGATYVVRLKKEEDIDDRGNIHVLSNNMVSELLPPMYVTPEVFGAVGDGVTDDTEAIQLMFNTINENTVVHLKSKEYFFGKVYIEKKGIVINGKGVINGIFVINANEIKFDKCSFKKEIEFQYSRGSNITNCNFSGNIGIYVPADKTVTEPENGENQYNDKWFHAVSRLNISNCTFDQGVSCVQVYYDTAENNAWMRANDWIFSNNIIRGVNSSDAIHDMYIQGIDGIRIEGNTFFTADRASYHKCPILEIEKSDWTQIVNNNFFPATKEFIKLKDPTNIIIDSNHFAWQVYTDDLINSHPAISIEFTKQNQSLTISNNNASQLTGNFIELTKAESLYIYGNIIGNTCFFNDRTGGVTDGDLYVVYGHNEFKYIKCFSNIIIGNMSNDYYIEGYNVKTIGDGQSYELTAASNCTCTDGKCKTYNGYCNFSFSFKPNEATDAYTVFVSGMPKPLDSYYHFTVSDTNGNSYPAYIDNSGFKLRRASGTSTIFASGVYRV